MQIRSNKEEKCTSFGLPDDSEGGSLGQGSLKAILILKSYPQIVFGKLLKGDVNLQAAQEHGKRSAVSLSDLGAWIYIFNRSFKDATTRSTWFQKNWTLILVQIGSI